MAKKIVALYDSLTDAQGVVRDLIATGLNKDRIRLIGSEDIGEYSRHMKGVDLKETSRSAESRNDMSRVWHNLFGTGISEEDAMHYAEGVRQGGTIVSVDTSDEYVNRVVDIMNNHHPVDIENRLSKWRETGWSEGYSAGTGAAGSTARTETVKSGATRTGRETHRAGIREGEATIPVVEEELAIGKREIERGGVRVHTYVEQQPVEHDIRLRREEVHVERHPVDRPISEADLEKAFREESFELRETEEEAVVSKKARVVEEVTISKDVEEHKETVRDTLRHTRVDVEETGAIRDFDADRDYYEKHYNSQFSRSGASFREFEPAYRYGYNLALDRRHHGRRWEEVEPEARNRWESEHKGSWSKFKDAVRYGWNRATK